MDITDITTNGPSATAEWLGGFAAISFTGTFDGAVCQIEYSGNGGVSWSEALPRNPYRLFEATGVEQSVDIPAGLVRVHVRKAGAATSLTAAFELSDRNLVQVADEAARLVLTTVQAAGKVVKQIDTGESYKLIAGADPTETTSWVKIGDAKIITTDIEDSGVTGRALVQSADAATARAAIGVSTVAEQDQAIASKATANAMVLRDVGFAEVADAATLRAGQNDLAHVVDFNYGVQAFINNGGIATKGAANGFELRASGTAGNLAYRENDVELATIAAALIPSGTRQIALVRRYATGVLDWYANGVKVQSNTSLTFSDISGTSALRIGRNSASAYQGGNYRGYHQLSFAPTDAEVAEIFRSGLPYVYRQGSFLPDYTADWSVNGNGWVMTAVGSDYSITGNNDSVTDGTTSKDDCLAINRTGAGTGAALIGRETGSIDRITRQNEITCWVYVPVGTFTISTVYFTFSSVTTTGRVAVTEGEWTLVKFTDSGLDIGVSTDTRTRLQPYTAATGSTPASMNTGETWYVADFTQRILGAVINLSADTIATEPAQWRDASGNGHHGLIHTTGAYSLKNLERDKLSFLNIDATGGAYLGRSGAMAKAGVDVERVYLKNNSGVDAVDLVLQYSDGTNHTDMFTAFTLAAGAEIYVNVLVAQPTGRNRYRVTGTSGITDLTFDIYRINQQR